MTTTQAVALSSWLALEPSRHTRSAYDSRESLQLYERVLGYILVTCEADNVVTETVGDIPSLHQENATIVADTAQTLYEDILQWGNTCPELQHNKMIVERLVALLEYSRRVNWNLWYVEAVFQFANYAHMLRKLRHSQESLHTAS